MHSSYFGNRTVKKKVETNFAMGSLSPQFELNEMEATFHQAILKQQADDNPFTISRRSETNSTIVIVNHARASMEEAQTFKEMMFAMIHQGHRDFIIDLSNCNFMDSTFLGAIILITKKNLPLDGSIVLVAKPEKLKVLYALKELSKILSIYETIDEATNN